MHVSKNAMMKMISTLAFFLITMAILLLRYFPESNGYEITIYDYLPSIFWICISTILIIIIYSLFANNYCNNKIYINIFIIINILNIFFIITLLPYFRNYGFFPFDDTLTHVGFVKDIIIHGHTSSLDFYPLIHYFYGIIHLITKIHYFPLNLIIALFFSFIFLIGIYILAKKMTNRLSANYALGLSLPFIFLQFIFSMNPNYTAILMFPLFYWIVIRYLENQSNYGLQYTILLIFFSIYLILLHPIICLYLLVIFICLTIYFGPIKKSYSYNKYKNIIIIISIVFFSWYFSFIAIQNDMILAYQVLFEGKGSTLFLDQTSQMSYYNLPIFYLIWIFINKFGVLLLLSLLCFIPIFIKGKYLLKYDNKFQILFVTLIISSTFSLFSFIGYTGEYDILRISRFFIWIEPIIIAYIIYSIHSEKIKFKKFKSLVHISMILIIIIATMNVFQAPWNNSTNYQVTKMDLSGSDWFLNHYDSEIPIYSMVMGIDRFEYYFYGVHSSNHSLDISHDTPKSHFGYDDQIGPQFNNISIYIIMYKRAIQYSSIYPENIREKTIQYSDNDLSNIHLDKNVQLIYSSRELPIFITTYR